MLAHESKHVNYEIRQFNFGRRTGAFRVLFTIRGDTVQILHVRRAVLEEISREEFEGPIIE